MGRAWVYLYYMAAGVRHDRTLWFKCATRSLFSSPADDIWNETRLSQPFLYWIHQSHASQWQLCLSSKIKDLMVTHGCSVCLHCDLSGLKMFSTTFFLTWQCLSGIVINVPMFQSFANCIFNSAAAHSVIQVRVTSVTLRLLRLCHTLPWVICLYQRSKSLPWAAPSVPSE